MSRITRPASTFAELGHLQFPVSFKIHPGSELLVVVVWGLGSKLCLNKPSGESEAAPDWKLGPGDKEVRG